MSDASNNQWTEEYKHGGIPSSTRESPSGAVIWAVDELRKSGVALRTALDVGCGKGRNSLFLAREGMDVTAIDFTPTAVEHLQKNAAAQKLAHKIRAIPYDVTEPWPVAAASMDLIIDAFCFKHITSVSARREYRSQMLRALRVKGYYMISFASIGDGYYGRYIVERDNKEEVTVNDPSNGIQSVLFTPQRVLQFFAPEMVLFQELHNTKPSVMHGQEYERSSYALLLRRNPHMV